MNAIPFTKWLKFTEITELSGKFAWHALPLSYLPASIASSKSLDRDKILNSHKRFRDYIEKTYENGSVEIYQLKAVAALFKRMDTKLITANNVSDHVHKTIDRAHKQIEDVDYSIHDYILWAMPSFGFIGTVLGIAQALGDADKVVKAIDQTAQASAVTGVTTVLGVAFDTTLVALLCSIPLMFFIQHVRANELKFLLSFERDFLGRLTKHSSVGETDGKE